ncbi:hypothetical protein A1A1_07859 [Planococcus antarcticus DSM 14505]|uniref:Uncharacterized protein n=1 Tax=Planococcus antarcticus DSM 14505 TaxID=1185653 RepID=A0AA87ILZ8_9BACL|nr:hypothetical protein A1A1_07859 [Planococcus antarcticus DSM 14505]
MQVDEQGNCLVDLQHSAIGYHGVTGVVESSGTVYFASIEQGALLAVRLTSDTGTAANFYTEFPQKTSIV